jgi:hypothetical protein
MKKPPFFCLCPSTCAHCAMYSGTRVNTTAERGGSFYVGVALISACVASILAITLFSLK